MPLYNVCENTDLAWLNVDIAHALLFPLSQSCTVVRRRKVLKGFVHITVPGLRVDMVIYLKVKDQP